MSAFYADLVDKQATQFQILTYTILAVVVIVIGATWWWNYKGAKSQISEEITSNKETLMSGRSWGQVIDCLRKSITCPYDLSDVDGQTLGQMDADGRTDEGK